LITFATTGTNDFLLSGRSLAFASDIDAVLLVCRHAAQAILGEMVFAQDQGMPYFETVWVGAPTTAPFEAAFRDRIGRVSGVVSIDDLTTEQIGDAMRYSATITTIYGTGTIDG
jgi:hypothetical protein